MKIRPLMAAGLGFDFMEDFWDSVEEAMTNMVNESLNAAMELLSVSLETDGMVSDYLNTHPANFTGTSEAGATAIWSTIELLCNNAVVPIAGMILAIILINDLIQTVISGNNFHDFDTSIFVKWVIKCLCGIMILSNTFYIASGIFSFGVNATSSAISTLLGTTEPLNGSISIADDYNVGTLFVLLVISGLLLIGILALIAVIIVVLCSRIIEIFMYLGVSPIPAATFMNRDWQSMGYGWLRNLLALSFQGMFIIIALAIFTTLFENVVANLSTVGTGTWAPILQMGTLMGYVLALIFTILRSGSISKSIFGAH